MKWTPLLGCFIVLTVLSGILPAEARAMAKKRPPQPAPLLKDLPQGSSLALKQKLFIDRPTQNAEGLKEYTLRVWGYGAEGPRVDEPEAMSGLVCRFHHVIGLTEPLVIPEGTRFIVKETREFEGDFEGRQETLDMMSTPLRVTALRFDYSDNPEIVSVTCAVQALPLREVTVEEFEQVMGSVVELALPPVAP